MIERLVSVALYLALPLVGILFFGWDWRSVVLLYWFQNITVGLRTVIDLIRTRTPPKPTDTTSLTVNGRPVSGGEKKPLLIAFFIFHYGIFTAVHGAFVFLIVFGLFNGLFGTSAAQQDGSGLNLRGIVIVWAIGSAVQLVLGFLVPRANLPPMKALFSAPYSRIFVLHFTVLIGVGLILFFSWPPAAAILLVALQFVVDLWKSPTGSKRRAKVPK